MAYFKFSEKDLSGIREAVQAVEKKTAGEIAVAFTRASSDYAVFELLFSVFCGLLYFMMMFFFLGSIDRRIQGLFWDHHLQLLVMFYGFSTFLVIAVGYGCANVPWIDRLIVPRKIMQRLVHQRALRYFMESGIHHTRDHTGVLIFISYLEHRVEILADRGISRKIPQAEWDALIAHIITGIKNGRLPHHLIEVITRCGAVLTEHFPIQPDDHNELHDGLVMLENGAY